MGARIIKIESYLPQHIITNEDLAKDWSGWDPNRYEAKTGIASRRVVKASETSLDMAEKAFTKISIEEKDSIDFLIFCTETPDMLFPSNANLMHGRLGLKKSVGALDINLGCSGYVYGLALAKGLIESNIAKKVAFITADTYSQLISPEDRASRALFGDAATVTIIEHAQANHIGEFVYGSDGSKAHALYANKYKYDNTINHLFMDGSAVFSFMMDIVPILVSSTLEKNNISLENINKVILHQANSYILEHLREKLQIPQEKFFNDMRMEGNTVSSTIPLALEKCICQGNVNTGDRVLLAGFGVGLSWAATTIIL